ncbi:MAG: aldolase-type tim barrel, partial [Myxococcaceae bacterium]|nr:aldolase-type tim barrel [Myxococcaceae bacterium]
RAVKLTLFVNHLCNLRCSYCYTGAKTDRRMSEETMRRAIDFAVNHTTQGYLLLAFFGGEPLLEPKLIEDALLWARDRCIEKKLQLHTAITTNGTELDDRRLALLKKHGFRVKLSMDGGRASQDANRRFVNGRSSYDVVAANLQRILAAGIPTVVGAVVDPNNVHLLGESFDDLVGLGATHVTFAPNYTADWSLQARGRFEQGLTGLGDRYLAQLRAGREVRVDPLVGKIVTHLDHRATARAVCRFGVSELAVAPSGRLYPCDRLVNEDADDAVCIGDLERGILAEKRDRLLPSRREEPQMCSGCDLKSRCKRFCGCANYETTGDPGTVSPTVCYFEQAFIDEADRVGNVLYAEQNPVFLKQFYRGHPGVEG